MTDVKSDDAVLAVVLNELRHIREDHRSLRDEIKEDGKEIRKEVKENREFFTKEIADVKADISKVKEFTTKWRGGYIALAGLGALLAWGVGSIANIWRIVN